MGKACEKTRCVGVTGKTCELCGDRATLHCSADDAELCWSCDAKVHGANYLVARHMRLVLCKHCSAETECRTSGPSPCPLCRSCAACEPAHVEQAEEVNLKGPGSVLSECNDDSEGLPAPAVLWLKRGGSALRHCVSQESLNDACSSVEDEKAARKSFTERDTRGKPKKMKGGGCRVAVPTNKRSLAPGGKEAPVKKSRRKRSRSPVSVIPVESSMCCNGSYSDTAIAM